MNRIAHQLKCGEMPPRNLLWMLLSINVVVIFIATYAGIRQGDPGEEFREGRSMTPYSSFQLLLAGFVTACIWWQRRKTERGRSPWRSTTLIWLLVACGFVFLAADESYEYHEGVDRWIHSTLGMEESGLSDRLDDLIVVVYGLVGLAFLYRYRAELARVRALGGYFIAGALMMGVMIGLDALTNRRDMLFTIFGDEATAERMFVWLGTAEDWLKLLGEAVVITALYGAYSLVRAEQSREGPGGSTLATGRERESASPVEGARKTT